MKKIILVFAIILEQIGITIPSNWVSVNPYQANTNTVSPAASYLDEISPLPQKIQETDANIQARSFILIDRNTSKVMAEKESNIRIPMASLTKIMAATIVLEKAKLEDKVNISKNAVSSYGEGIDLSASENLTVEDLLYGALLSSSNDSCVAMAEHVSGTEEEFAKIMNEKVKELGLKNTHFTNAAGLDDFHHYSSAFDLAILTKYALQNEKFKEIVNTKEKTITSSQGISHHLRNSNKLLFLEDLNVLGVKTGYTGESGECLITEAEKDNNKIIAVVLNSPDRFGESKKLLKWGFEDYKW